MNEDFNSYAEEQFFHFLLRKGYPRDSISLESWIDGKFRADIAITDPELNQRLAYFEVKGPITENRQHVFFDQLRAYADAARISGASAYLVSVKENAAFEEPFDFYYADADGKVNRLPIDLFPTFKSLSSSIVAGKRAKFEKSREETKDHFQSACWGLSGFVLIALIADFILDRFSIELLDTTRLTLLGIVVALVVIPFAQKFKVLGLEYERFIRKANEEKPKS